MLIAQITDLHIGFEPDNPDEYNQRRLRRVLARIAESPDRPELMLVTGNLTEHGAPAGYRRLTDLLEGYPVPWHPIPGTHDDRTSFSRAFPDIPTPGGFVQYAVDAGPLRVLMLDTLEEGRQTGGFCTVRAEWLRRQLAEEPNRPTLIAMHHPPVDAGIEWMRTDRREPWVQRFADAIAGHAQVRGIVCGHLHLPVSALWRGTAVTVAPAVAPGLVRDHRPIDVERPDFRPLVVADAPGYAMHWWNGEELVSFPERVADAAPIAKFDAHTRPMVRHLIKERANSVRIGTLEREARASVGNVPAPAEDQPGVVAEAPSEAAQR